MSFMHGVSPGGADGIRRWQDILEDQSFYFHHVLGVLEVASLSQLPQKVLKVF